MTTHERPGVYSDYAASALVSGGTGGSVVGLAALSAGGTAGTAHHITSYDAAVSIFGSGDAMTGLIRVLLLNGASGVVAVPVERAEDYGAAFAALEEEESVAVVVCDATDLTTQQALRTSVKSASEARRERIAVVCGGPSATVGDLVTQAGGLNSERVVLVAPEEEDGAGAVLAAAVAGAIAGEGDPAIPMGGAVLRGVGGLTRRYTDGEIDLLVRGGVTPLESVSGETSIVRAVTTRTKTGETADSTWRELTTIRVVDHVIPAVRRALRAKFQRAKNTAQARGAIRAQVIVELENKVSREIITGYDAVRVSALEENPTVCLVEFSFTVAHGLNQIWLSAHITV
ncbi:MAG: phage tail sheath protein [Clostridiales bacterium]|nr:phage tail sheath protein [Clostridiales bacterium]